MNKTEIGSFFVLLLVEWDLRQNGRFDYVFGLFGIFVRVHQLAAWIYQTCRHENDKVPFDVLFHVRAEETADENAAGRDLGATVGRGALPTLELQKSRLDSSQYSCVGPEVEQDGRYY